MSDDLFSGKHNEDEPCDGCGVRPSVSMGHGSYSCEACFEARWCPKCRYTLTKDHVCPSPEERAERERVNGYWMRDLNREESYQDACLRLDLEVRTLAAQLAAAREALREMASRAMGHAYATSMAEGGEEIQAQELAYERQQHKETLAELRATEQMVFDANAKLAAAREALDWYATSENYMHKIERNKHGDPEVCEATWRPVVLDAGKRARDALEALRAKKEGV